MGCTKSAIGITPYCVALGDVTVFSYLIIIRGARNNNDKHCKVVAVLAVVAVLLVVLSACEGSLRLLSLADWS